MARRVEPLDGVVEIYSRLNRLRTSVRRIWEVIEMTPSVTERRAALRLPSPTRGHVEMRGVSFSYSDRRSVLQGFNLKLEAGIKVGLVGVSGSGKSTAAKLMARLYDVDSGAVYIDGIDVRDLPLGCLRTKVCYVIQDAVLFDRTLKENVLLGDPSATMKDLLLPIELP